MEVVVRLTLVERSETSFVNVRLSTEDKRSSRLKERVLVEVV